MGLHSLSAARFVLLGSCCAAVTYVCFDIPTSPPFVWPVSVFVCIPISHAVLYRTAPPAPASHGAPSCPLGAPGMPPRTTGLPRPGCPVSARQGPCLTPARILQRHHVPLAARGSPAVFPQARHRRKGVPAWGRPPHQGSPRPAHLPGLPRLLSLPVPGARADCPTRDSVLCTCVAEGGACTWGRAGPHSSHVERRPGCRPRKEASREGCAGVYKQYNRRDWAVSAYHAQLIR